MKTGVEMVKDVTVRLGPVSALINGVLISWKRPKNSTRVDVVVNSLSLSNQPLQEGTVNVNIHGTNKAGVSFNGVTDDGQPDLTILTPAHNKILELLDGNWQSDYHTDCEPGVPIRDTDGTWYINVRVNYYAFQDNFKNI